MKFALSRVLVVPSNIPVALSSAASLQAFHSIEDVHSVSYPNIHINLLVFGLFVYGHI